MDKLNTWITPVRYPNKKVGNTLSVCQNTNNKKAISIEVKLKHYETFVKPEVLYVIEFTSTTSQIVIVLKENN